MSGMAGSVESSGRTALVTGGARRIGRAIVEDLAAHGFAVAIHCNSSGEHAQSLANKIRANGGQATVVTADLCNRSEALDAIEEAGRVLGPVELLVNNASVFTEDSIEDIDWDIWKRHFAIHLEAPAILSEHFARNIPADRQGLIVNIIDQRVWKLTPRYFSYTLSKSALWTATQTMAQALAPRIRVNAIGPGPTLRNQRQDQALFERQVDAVLLGRGPELSEFGRTIRYLWQSPSVTGQMIAIDGGQHLAWQTPDVTDVGE